MSQRDRPNRLMEFSAASSLNSYFERDLLKKAPAILFVASAADMKVRFVSDFAEELLGISARSWTDDSSFWQQHVYGEDRPSVLSERAEAVRKSQEYDLEYRMLGKNDEVLWVRELGRIIVADGEALVVGVIVDLTKKRSAMEALGEGKRWLRWLIDGIPVQIWSSDAEGNVDFCNARWRDELGLSLEDLRDGGWQKIIHAEDLDRVRAAWDESVKKDRSYEQVERHRRRAGSGW